jgi:alpha-glucosidase
MIILINNREEERELEVNVWPTGISRLEESVLTRVMLSDRN